MMTNREECDKLLYSFQQNGEQKMKDYIKRLTAKPSWLSIAWWWILRIITAFFFVKSVVDGMHISVPVQLGLSLAAMFGWEICMAAPKKSFMRLVSPVYQNISVLLLFITAIGGKYFGIYNRIPMVDAVLQFIFGGFMVFVGYEIACTLSIRDKYSCTKAMHFWVAFGIAFIAMNALELFEFTFDQLLGLFTGTPGNAQNWSAAIAEETERAKTFLPAIDPGRWPIMDLMADIILGTVSAFIALLVINLWPYRLRGKFKYDMDFGDEDAAKKQFGTVNGEKK